METSQLSKEADFFPNIVLMQQPLAMERFRHNRFVSEN